MSLTYIFWFFVAWGVVSIPVGIFFGKMAAGGEKFDKTITKTKEKV